MSISNWQIHETLNSSEKKDDSEKRLLKHVDERVIHRLRGSAFNQHLSESTCYPHRMGKYNKPGLIKYLNDWHWRG